MAGRFAIALLSSALAAAVAADDIVSLGKQKAAASRLQWDVREAGHPILGPIQFATLKTPIATAAGGARTSSNIYLSCERNTGKMAIELANGTRPDDPGGLKPKRLPRLTCNTFADGKPLAEPIDATWTVNELGDAMARGFWPSALRDCLSIVVSEELVLPPGSAQPTARVEFEITPYARELDRVFATCGEPTVYASAPTSPAAPSIAAGAKPAAVNNGNGWSTVRLTASGRTNVRQKPTVRSALVIRLYPGDIVLVQKSAGEWWHAKSRPNSRFVFEGYIRRDRVVSH